MSTVFITFFCPEIFWVLPKALILHGHCAPRSAVSCEILILCPMSHDSGRVLSFLIQ